LSPRGKVLEGGMPRFFRRLAMGVFDVADLKRRTHELGEFVEEATTAYGLDHDRIVAVGYSNGANIAASLLLLRPGLLRAAALLHAMVPYEPDELPDLVGTSVLVTAGRHDPMIPTDHPERLARMLEQAHADVTLEWQPGGHELGRAELAAVKSWLDQLHP
jgi:predicted esterase